MKQIQTLLEQYIVPAILDNDEIQRNRQVQGMRGRTASMDSTSSPEHGKVAAWKLLINHLEQFYKQFQHFGLDRCYSEQIFHQLLYFICAVALNCLMLRGDICMWETGMIIRYNLGYIEDWVRSKKMVSKWKWLNFIRVYNLKAKQCLSFIVTIICTKYFFLVNFLVNYFFYYLKCYSIME